jgi:hypothetical protein
MTSAKRSIGFALFVLLVANENASSGSSSARQRMPAYYFILQAFPGKSATLFRNSAGRSGPGLEQTNRFGKFSKRKRRRR